jgi:hypothetical protein
MRRRIVISNSPGLVIKTGNIIIGKDHKPKEGESYIQIDNKKIEIPKNTEDFEIVDSKIVKPKKTRKPKKPKKEKKEKKPKEKKEKEKEIVTCFNCKEKISDYQGCGICFEVFCQKCWKPHRDTCTRNSSIIYSHVP